MIISKQDESRYTWYGYKDREDYLNNLAEEYGIELSTVKIISDMLGENEDFDGLITALNDYKEDG